MNKTYTVRPGDSLLSIAQQFHTTPDELREINKLPSDLLRVGQLLLISPIALTNSPQVKKHIVRPGESLYVIAKRYDLTVSELKQLNRLASSNLRVGQELIVSEPFNTLPTDEKQAQVANPSSDATKDDYEYYVVLEGESLYDIAQKHNTTMNQLTYLNQLTSNDLVAGQELKVPGGDKVEDSESSSSEFHLVVTGDSLYSIARKYGLSINEIRRLNALTSDTIQLGEKIRVQEKEKEVNDEPSIDPDIEFHQVQAGESLYSIARVHQLSIKQIKELNNLESDNINVGQLIRVKKDLPKISSKTDSDLVLPNIKDFPFEIKSYIEARKIFQLEVHNGVDIFGKGLKGAVGRNRVNRAEDLDKIQRRLVQLYFLAPDHQESPEDLKSKNGGAAITANYIPKTIAAIEHFQKKFNVSFWTEHSSRVAMMQSNQYMPGVIYPNDVTYKVLREYTDYQLTFPHPHTSELQSLSFHNFPIHPDVKFYQGVDFEGGSNPEIPSRVFTRLGLPEGLAQSLKYIAKNEANFDTIRSYKESIFDYGFVQFAGNGGTLALLLANIKQKAPRIFKDFFQNFGLDVTFQKQGETIQNAELIIANPYDKGGKYLVKGKEAERIIRADKQLYGIFIRAGYYLPIVTLQIDTAIQYYIQPALNIRLSIIAGALSLPDLPITDLIRSPMGLALLMSLVISKKLALTQEIIRDTIEKIAIKHSLYTEEKLLQINEQEIVTRIIADAHTQGETDLIQKATGILHSGLSWQKLKDL